MTNTCKTKTLEEILSSIRSLALVGPQDTMMALSIRGDVYGWGFNQYDQLCIPNEQIPAKSNEQATPLDLTKAGYIPAGVTMMAGAGNHATYYAAGTTATRPTLWSCGQNRDGDLGIGSTTVYTNGPGPQQVTGVTTLSSTNPVVLMTASWSDEGVLLKDGSYWTWGDNKFGQLGNGTRGGKTYGDAPYETLGTGQVEIAHPTGALFPDQTVTQGGGGNIDGQAVAILTDGSYYGWGDDQEGQLCNGNSGTDAKYDTPTAITLPSKVMQPLTEVASGGTDGYLLDSSANVWSCGANNDGQLGINRTDSNLYPHPHEVMAGNAMSVSSTQYKASVVQSSTGSFLYAARPRMSVSSQLIRQYDDRSRRGPEAWPRARAR
jgi:alpha-tubulin suppressor-like RCC1 family protein